MSEAYIIDAVRTAVGKRNGALSRCTRWIWVRPPSRVCSTASTSIPTPSTTCTWVCLMPSVGRPEMPDVWPGSRADTRKRCRCHRRPAVWLESAGHLLCRPSCYVRHRGPDRGGWFSEHEPDSDLGRHARRQGIWIHLAHGRVRGLAAPLRRSGDLPVPRRRNDRREVGHQP